MEDDERQRAHDAASRVRWISESVTAVHTELVPLHRACGWWQLASMVCMGGVVVHIVFTSANGGPAWLWWSMVLWIAGGLVSLWFSQRYIKRIRVAMNGLTERIAAGPPAARYDPLHERYTE